jgi:hypothetical protein
VLLLLCGHHHPRRQSRQRRKPSLLQSVERLKHRRLLSGRGYFLTGHEARDPIGHLHLLFAAFALTSIWPCAGEVCLATLLALWHVS